MNGLISKEVVIDTLKAVRDLVWDVDIPSPTVPEYIEHHEQMQSIMRNIDILTDKIIKMPSAQPKAIRPKFVAEDRYRKNYFQMFPHCPKCNYELETGDCYCRVCGCHIDWDEDDE